MGSDKDGGLGYGLFSDHERQFPLINWVLSRSASLATIHCKMEAVCWGLGMKKVREQVSCQVGGSDSHIIFLSCTYIFPLGKITPICNPIGGPLYPAD